ncbi:response regulator [Candidatus Omnitrophota bacterium]
MKREKKVLVIDDEVCIVDIIDSFFKANGLSVERAHDGKKGLNMLKKDPSIDLVIVDEKMPGLGGTDFLKEIERLKIKTPVLVLTGSINLTQLDESVKRLCNKILIKPVRLSELLKISNRLMSKTVKK